MNRRSFAVIALLSWSIVASTVAAQNPEDRIALAGPALMSARPQDAKPHLLEALEEYRAVNDVHGECATLILLGLTEMATKELETGEAHLREATAKLRARDDAFGTWMALLILSQIEQGTGRFQSALSTMEEALALLEHARTSSAPLTFATFAAFARAVGQGAPELEMLPMLEQLGGVMKPMIIDSFAMPVTRDMYGSLLTDAGEYQKAEEQLTKAAAGSLLLQGKYDFSIASHFGDLRFRQKRYDEAKVHYEKALQGSIQSPLNPLGDQLIRMVIYDRLSKIEMITGNIEEALAWNDKALAVTRALRNPLHECLMTEVRGRMLMRSERFRDAEGMLKEALEIAETNEFVAERAAIEATLGTVYLMSGNYGAAASHIEVSIGLYQGLKDPVSEAAAWGNLANVYMLTATPAVAENALARARQLADASQFELGRDLVGMMEVWIRFRKGTATAKDVEASFDRVLNNPHIGGLEVGEDLVKSIREVIRGLAGGDVTIQIPDIKSIPVITAFHYFTEGVRAHQKGNLEEARAFWDKALKRNPSSDMHVRILGMIGASYWRERDFEQASRVFTEASTVMDASAELLRSDIMLSGFFGGELRAFYDVLIETHLRNGDIEAALDISERARARAFLRLVGNDRIKLPETVDSSLARELSDVKTQIQRTPYGPELQGLRTRYEALLTRLQAVTPEYASMTNVQPLQLAEVRKELPADTSLISYFITPFGASAWILDAESLEHVRLPMGASQLTRISCWTAHVGNERSVRVPGDCGTDKAKPEEAYAILFAPLRSKIKTTRLVIVPHAELHYVPFAALYDPASKHYLVQDYTIMYAPSASTLRFLGSKESRICGKALVLGDPSTTLTSLKGANSEATKIAAMFGTRPRTGRDAGEYLLYELNKTYDLIHIAAHAGYDSANPLFSGIALAKGGDRDGLLSVDEIQSEVDLTGVNLVVLAACQSGLGRRSGGDEIVGLTRAILYAGSPGVISTLWNINDLATTPLMETFYRHLLDGKAAADALRLAQIELLSGKEYSKPAYWAAFVLTGTPAGSWKLPSKEASKDDCSPSAMSTAATAAAAGGGF